MSEHGKDITRILFLAANPENTVKLKLIQESNDIEDNLGPSSSKFDFRQRHAVTFDDLRNMLLKYKPHIVHFSGHGSQDGALIFEDENNKPVKPQLTAISNLFSILKENIYCVVLNACFSEDQARSIAKHIPYVIGMNTAISDQAAIKFAVTFYDSLANEVDIKTAYELGRNALENLPYQEQNIPQLLQNEVTIQDEQTHTETDIQELEKRYGIYSRLSTLDQTTYQIFENQRNQRDELTNLLRQRFDTLKYKTFEDMFSDLYLKFNRDEKFKAEYIRQLTDQLHKYNSEILQILDDNDELFYDMPMLRALHDHLNLWLAKYNASKKRKDMFMIYVGDKEKKRYPVFIGRLLNSKTKKIKKLLDAYNN